MSYPKQEGVYFCPHCNKLMSMTFPENPCIACCDEPPKEYLPQEIKEDNGQHLPVVWAMANIFLVEIGNIPHPMEDEHCIVWICLKSQKGMEIKILNPGDKPEARFYLDNDKPLGIYVYCSLHGLWFKALNEVD